MSASVKWFLLIAEAGKKKGVRTELQRSARQDQMDGSTRVRLHKRLAEVERLLAQARAVLSGSALPVHMAGGAAAVSIMANFDLDVSARLASCTSEATRCRAEAAATGLRRRAADEAMAAAVGQWLVSTRLRAQHLPPPLAWRQPQQQQQKGTAARLLAACPWPLLVLAGRATPAAHDHPQGRQLLGVFAGDAKRWLAHAAGHQAGDRGWGELCVRGDKADYVLYELGRFAEMIVWGNPFVLELVLIEKCKGGHVLHATPEWRALTAQFAPEQLLTARAIMQIMSTVQAQLKLLIANGKPFGEEFVALAELLHLTREVVVAKVGRSEAGEAFNDWNFWREPIAVLEEEKAVAAVANDRDGPACMPTALVDVEANFDVDKTSLRECLVELDELRPKWSVPGVFSDAGTVQKQLDAWFVPIRLASLN